MTTDTYGVKYKMTDDRLVAGTPLMNQSAIDKFINHQNTTITSNTTTHQSIKQYNIVLENTIRSRLSITPKDHTGTAYRANLSYVIKDLIPHSKKHSVVLRSLSSSSTEPESLESSVVGVGDISFLSSSYRTRFCLGDPIKEQDSTPPAWTKLPIFSVNFGKEECGNPSTFKWKRTGHGDGIVSVAGKVDWLSLKLQNLDTGEIVARFVHYPWPSSKRGYFEILSDQGYGEKWTEIVLLSGLTILEYRRKTSGWSW